MALHYAAAIAAMVLNLAAAADPPQSPAAMLEAIQKEVKDAQAAYYKADAALPDTPESSKKAGELFKEFDKTQADGFMAAVELAKADPKSETAFAALEWVLTTPRAYYVPAGKPALELATEHYAADPKIGKAVAWVESYFPNGQGAAADEAAAFVQAVATKNPDRTVRGQAVMGLAHQARNEIRRGRAQEIPGRGGAGRRSGEGVRGGHHGLRRLPPADSGERGDSRRTGQAGTV